MAFDTSTLLTLPKFVFLIVFASWVAFIALFRFRRRSRKEWVTKRDATSRWGIALQGVAFGSVWAGRRLLFTPTVTMPRALEILWAAVTIAIAIGSVWLCMSAVRALGKQWTYVARIIEGHQLVTQGPYRIVRNPIYLGMFGMLVATGLAVSRWWVLCIAIVVFLAGSAVRIRSEEKLLREAFGAEFEAYMGRVPAMFPRF